MSKCVSSEDDTLRNSVHPRVVMFARFLGLRYEHMGTIPLEGLNVYLLLAYHAQRGAVPLFPSTPNPCMVDLAHFEKAIDVAFCLERYIVRESIKVALRDENRGQSEIDIDLSLEFVMSQWQEIQKKWDTRLSALFVSIDSKGDGNISYNSFQEVMVRLSDERQFPSFRRRVRMFAQMCSFLRVDSSVFAEECRHNGLSGFSLGTFKDHEMMSKQGSEIQSSEAYELANMDNSEDVKFDKIELFRTLAPKYKFAQGVFEKIFKEVKTESKEADLSAKWSMLEKIMEEQADPHLAAFFLNTVTLHQYGVQAHELLTSDYDGESRNGDRHSESPDSGTKSIAMQRAALGGSSFRIGGNRHQASFRAPAGDPQFGDMGTVAHSPLPTAKTAAYRAPATAAAAAVVKAGQRFLRSSVSSSSTSSVHETPPTPANTLNQVSSRNLSRMLQLAGSQSPDKDEYLDASAKPATENVTQQQKPFKRNSLSEFNSKYSMTML